MARKRLIKGANAARVEERIARVPLDLDSSSGIFGAIRAMEEAEGKPPQKVLAEQSPAKAKRSPAKAKPKEEKLPRADAAVAEAKAKGARLRPSDFNAAERETILRCCADYRNRLPTYLLAVQKELRVIDSVMEKCRSSGRKRD
jgi:hypothetical protein